MKIERDIFKDLNVMLLYFLRTLFPTYEIQDSLFKKKQYRLMILFPYNITQL